MNTLYLEGSTPLSSEKIIGALVALGLKPSALEWEFSKIELGAFHMHFDREQIDGVEGVHFSIHEGATHSDDEDAHEHEHSHECCGGHHHKHTEKPHEHKHSEECCDHDHEHNEEHDEHDSEDSEPEMIHELLMESELSPLAKERVFGIFNRLAVSEETVDVDLDEFVEIVGIAVGIELLKIDRVFVSESLQKNADPISAAILAEFHAESTNAAPKLQHEIVGCGIGFEHSAEASNFVRAHLGEPVK